MNFKHLLTLIVFTISMPAAAHAQRNSTASALVYSVVDGDTLVLIIAGHKVRWRMADIDCPELDQPYGEVAHADLVKLIMGQAVNVIPRGTDRYGRTIGTVWFGRLNVNEALVDAGDAWAYPAYDLDPAMPAFEAEARADHRGLWADPAPIPPWEWRREHRR